MKLFRIKKYLKRAILFFLVFMIILLIVPEFIANERVKLGNKTINVPDSYSRVLIFAPHNDDEVLGAGALIKKTLEQGGSVKVVLITNGDGFQQGIQIDYHKLFPIWKDYIKFGYERQNESINALKILGLSKSDIVFLGYPDGGVSMLWDSYWDANHSYKSSFTHENKSIYSDTFSKDTAYTGENLISDISKIIIDYKPTYIVYPHPNDHHPDHWATNAFVKYALTLTNYKPQKEWLYLVHRGDWPTPLFKDTDGSLLPPAKLINKDTQWYFLRLNSNDIIKKSQAISSYRSQLRSLGLILSAFERKNELFGVYSDVILQCKLHNDRDISLNPKNLVITDPAQDGVQQKILKGADITGVYTEMSKENRLHLFVKLDAGFDRFITYKINLIFFESGKTRRMNIEIANGKIKFPKISSTSIVPKVNVKWDISHNKIHVILPSTLTGSFDHLFIDAETSLKNIQVDKTAWRMIDN